MQTEGKVANGARVALGLLLTINLFNYIDRYILAAVLPRIRTEFLAGDPNQSGKAGLLMTAFLLSYMVAAPIFGWLADRVSRWWLIAVSMKSPATCTPPGCPPPMPANGSIDVGSSGALGGSGSGVWRGCGSA